MERKLQKELLEFTQNNLPLNQKLPAWLCDIFQIDQSSAYRRIRGETELSFTEFIKLVNAMPDVSIFLRSKLKPDNGITGELSYFSDWDSLRRYYEKILNTLTIASKLNHSLCYVARDLPFFCFYGNPYLMRYKLSVWAQCGGFRTTVTPPDDLIDIGAELFKVYQKLNTTEIWYVWGVHNQVSQLLYWYEMDYITKEEVMLISDGFCDVMQQYELWLQDQKKPGGGDITIYTSDFCIMNNGGLLHLPGKRLLMNGFQGIHFLNTREAQAIQLFENHWNSHIALASSISGSNTRSRYLFFKNIREKIEREVNKIVQKDSINSFHNPT